MNRAAKFCLSEVCLDNPIDLMLKIIRGSTYKDAKLYTFHCSFMPIFEYLSRSEYGTSLKETN